MFIKKILKKKKKGKLLRKNIKLFLNIKKFHYIDCNRLEWLILLVNSLQV